ncbi:TPA: homoserine O-succinyltransferase, partial [Escherichia coli]|nr:homoserine O-succinyltransferase [Escherichia coli]
ILHPHALLTRGFDDSFLAPHSRYADFPAALIRDYTDLEILAETEEGDAYLFASKDKRIAFVTGHPEYDAQTLAQEYFRDVEAGLDPDVPYNYFPHNDPQNTPRASWRSHGNLLFTNWLNYYVYQITPYDLRHMNPTLD